MKTRTKTLLTALTATAALSAGTSQAAIIAGDTIVIDFSKTTAETASTATSNWNNLTRSTAGFGTDQFPAAGSEQTLITNLVRYSDGANTGVSVTRTGGSGTAGIGGATIPTQGASASFSVSGVIPDAAQVDVFYADSTSEKLFINGLDDALTYDIELMAYINQSRSALDITVGGTTIEVDPDTTTRIYAYDGISSSGGTIEISFEGTSLQHINALELTAVPEPGSLALLGLGGLCMHKRRRRA
ncbi:MAG: PEP-CTERM sorting domain-containing protein [Phycisphaeraceae bacterium]